MAVGEFPLSNKIVVVTGGGSGLSFNFVELAVNQNNRVIIADLRLTLVAEELVKAHAGLKKLLFVPCDVTKWKDLNNLVVVSEQEFGDVPDVYIAGAGLFETVKSS